LNVRSTEAFCLALEEFRRLIIQDRQADAARVYEQSKEFDRFIDGLTEPDSQLQQALDENRDVIPGFFFCQVGLWLAYCKVDKGTIWWVLPDHESRVLHYASLKTVLEEAARSIEN